jgi:ABC-2 type transport system ATP-binding protein
MMYRGELIALASPDDLRERLPGALLQIETEHPNQAKVLIDELSGVLETSLHGVQLHVLVDEASRQKDIQTTLDSASLPAARIEEIQPSLEDVFIYLVEQSRAKVKEGI